MFVLGLVFSNLLLQAYTVLESSASSLIVDIFTGGTESGKQYGTLYFSDFNGTSFTKSLDYTNRNGDGNVDFEKIQGVEGIVLANIVSNPTAISASTVEKQLESRISFDDGGRWRFLSQPKDRVYACSQKYPSTGPQCSLHLHSITSPHDLGYIYSTSLAPGIVMGVGNVGDYLLPYDQCDTFLSRDGGITWTMAKTGANLYEIGSGGGVLVLMNDEEAASRLT